MTTADLGKQVKALHHPAYADLPDHVVGRAMQKRFPGLYAVVDKPELNANTIPETPRTLQIQMEQLRDGLRRVVFVARGAKAAIKPELYGAKRHRAPSGDFYFNPKLVKISEIDAAIHNHALNELLGATHAGYGAPPKEKLEGPVSAVVSRTPEGETVQGALSDSKHQAQTIEAAKPITPAGGSITVEHPAKELARRIKFRRAAGKKWPPPK